jgi:glycosyltransferase involved in cell wall biosynthesis
LRIVFLTPTHQSTARGNTVTVNRWEAGLRKHGHEVVVIENDEGASVKSMAPDILHAHHAVHCGPIAVDLAKSLPDTKVVISLGGTDLHGPTGSPADEGRLALAAADAIVGPFAADGEKLQAAFPECLRFHVVPRGVALRTSEPKIPGSLMRGAVVGGIRFVKGSIAALAWRAKTEAHGFELHLDFAGPLIEAEYSEKFLKACEQDPHANYLGELSPDETARLMQDSDFLLNFSESEGASNAILEALAAGRPVAARAVPGNIDLLASATRDIAHLIEPDATGLKSWFSWLEKLSMRSPEESYNQARKFVTSNYSCEIEIEALLKVYQQLTC